jgi:hypothetical protein
MIQENAPDEIFSACRAGFSLSSFDFFERRKSQNQTG